MDLGHSLVSQTSPKPKVLLICGISTTGIISSGNRSSIGPTKLNRILFIHGNFAFVTSDNWQGQWHWLGVCLLSLSVWNTCGVGGGLQTVFFARKPALKRLASAVRREHPTGRSSYCRRESFAPRLSCERTICRPDPTSEYVCFLRGSLYCELARRSAKIQQEAQLSPRDRAMRRVSWNLANCQATVQKILIRQVLNKSKLWSWRVKVGQCVINICTQPWRDRVASIVLWVS